MTLAGLIWNYAKYLLATFIMPPLTALFVLILDKRPIKPMLKGITMLSIIFRFMDTN